MAAQAVLSWACPVCGGSGAEPRYAVPPRGSEAGVDAASFRPSSDRFGQTVGRVVRCRQCGHASLAEPPAPADLAAAYSGAVDVGSLAEEAGQRRTAQWNLQQIEAHVTPGRLLEIGCWTGVLLDVARDRGWGAAGIEPSRWASEAARERGLDVQCTLLDEVELEPRSYRAIVACDVLEHLLDPGGAVDRCVAALEPGGVLFVTVPDAGSRAARVLGRRWWSVLPMHVQYFSRASLGRLLAARGVDVVDVSTHPKAFSVRYYAERVESFAPAMAAPVRFVSRAMGPDRIVAPDLRDRMAVVGIRR